MAHIATIIILRRPTFVKCIRVMYNCIYLKKKKKKSRTVDALHSQKRAEKINIESYNYNSYNYIEIILKLLLIKINLSFVTACFASPNINRIMDKRHTYELFETMHCRKITTELYCKKIETTNEQYIYIMSNYTSLLLHYQYSEFCTRNSFADKQFINRATFEHI